jgi:hypothetical protein
MNCFTSASRLLRFAQFDRRRVAMNTVTEGMPVVSTVSRGTVSERLFVIGYLTAIAAATVGWVSAFGWAALRLTSWVLA